jgi:plasmid replication initiation protein
MSSTEDILERIRRNLEAKTKNPNVEAEKEGNRDLLDNSVTKSNALARAYYRYSLSEKRVMEALISKIHPQRRDNSKEIELTAIEYGKTYGLSASAAYEQIAQAADGLQNRKILIENSQKHERISYVLAITAHYRDALGTIAVRFHPDIEPHLVGLHSHFTKYPLKHAVDFTSSYTWRFYELLASWAQPKKDTGGLFAGWISKLAIDELRKMLGVPESYKWDNIQKQVLNVVQAELKDKAGIDLFIERLKTSRKITHLNIKFIEIPKQETTEQAEKPKRVRKKAA